MPDDMPDPRSRGRNVSVADRVEFAAGGVRVDSLPQSTREAWERAVGRADERLPAAPRDRWGNWDAAFDPRSASGQHRTAWMDRQVLAATARHGGGQPSDAAAPLVLALSHDVDVLDRRVPPATAWLGLQRALTARPLAPPAMARAIARWAFKLLPRPATPADWRFHDWMELEDRNSSRSTFFFFPERVERPHPDDCVYRWRDPVDTAAGRRAVVEVMRALDSGGWEVGLHASIHAARDARLLASQRRALEDSLGARVTSVRFHYLAWDPALTPGVVAEAGFLTDSTLGFNLDVGFRAGTAHPWWLRTDDYLGNDVLEVPLVLMDSALYDPSALGCTEDEAAALIDHCLAEVLDVTGVLVANWHPNYWSSPLHRRGYERLLASAKGLGVSGVPIRAVDAWYRERASARQ